MSDREETNKKKVVKYIQPDRDWETRPYDFCDWI